jgi:hypothetical protein
MDKNLKNFPINEKQHGFLKGKSTESAISDMVDYIERNWGERKESVGVFLDISSAFDMIDPKHVKESLYKHGGQADLVEWYFDYIMIDTS